MNIEELITGVTVVYNTKTIIEKAITSIRRFHPRMKIIIIDGSDKTNPCYDYVCSLPDKYTRVFHVKENIGHGRGLHLGISYVDTPFFLTFDSDIEMLKSPLEDMLKMMKDDTYGVGYTEPVDVQGHDFGVNQHLMQYGSVKYMHPYFCLIQLKEYKKYKPFCHHGAPHVNTMLDIHKRGLSNIVLKEFPGLGHSSGHPINNVNTWKSAPREFIKHDRDGTKISIKPDWDKVFDVTKKITCITPTGDRPEAFALTRKWIESQILKPDQWLVVDDGFVPLPENLRQGIEYIRREPKQGEGHTLTKNIQTVFPHIKGDIILIIEDDDWYGPNYIYTMYHQLLEHELVGEGFARYYHVPSAKYYRVENTEHASFCQTGFTRSLLPIFQKSISGDPYIDMRLWLKNGKGKGFLFFDPEDQLQLHCSLKGLKGRKGIGTGHNEKENYYTRDINYTMLKRWVGEENANIYVNHVGGKINNLDEDVTALTVTYNTKELFEKCYNAFRRFHPTMKLIIVDGSTRSDSCYHYVQSLSSQITQVLHLDRNIGHGRGLCLGIEHIKTPFMLLFDSDTEILKSPVSAMLDMMEDDTYGVGNIEKTALDGFEWGAKPHHKGQESIRYLHPFFCLIQLKEYRKYRSFIHHGAPAINTMLDIHRKGLGNKILKEFLGLHHTSGRGFVWEGKPSEWVKHDTQGTRVVVRKKLKKEDIEGKWDAVIDVGPSFILPNNGISVITCTGDRPQAFEYLCNWMNNQTVKPSEWIIVDDGRVPMTVPNYPFIKYVRREPKSDDPKHTMILNFKEGLKYVTGDKIFVWEDDEYYAPDYINDLSILLDKYEVVGIGRSKYYHLPSSTYLIHPNMGHASLAQTAFRKSFLNDLNTVVDGNDFLDQRLWDIINPGEVNLKETGRSEKISKNGRGYIFDDKNKSLYVGMKGLPGRKGIGSGHKGIGTKDFGWNKLKEWIPNEKDFHVYFNFAENKNVDIPVKKIEENIQKPQPIIPYVAPPPPSKQMPKQNVITRLPLPRPNSSFTRRKETLVRAKTYQLSRRTF